MSMSSGRWPLMRLTLLLLAAAGHEVQGIRKVHADSGNGTPLSLRSHSEPRVAWRVDEAPPPKHMPRLLNLVQPGSLAVDDPVADLDSAEGYRCTALLFSLVSMVLLVVTSWKSLPRAFRATEMESEKAVLGDQLDEQRVALAGAVADLRQLPAACVLLQIFKMQQEVAAWHQDNSKDTVWTDAAAIKMNICYCVFQVQTFAQSCLREDVKTEMMACTEIKKAKDLPHLGGLASNLLMAGIPPGLFVLDDIAEKESIMAQSMTRRGDRGGDNFLGFEREFSWLRYGGRREWGIHYGPVATTLHLGCVHITILSAEHGFLLLAVLLGLLLEITFVLMGIVGSTQKELCLLVVVMCVLVFRLFWQELVAKSESAERGIDRLNDHIHENSVWLDVLGRDTTSSGIAMKDFFWKYHVFPRLCLLRACSRAILSTAPIPEEDDAKHKLVWMHTYGKVIDAFCRFTKSMDPQLWLSSQPLPLSRQELVAQSLQESTSKIEGGISDIDQFEEIPALLDNMFRSVAVRIVEIQEPGPPTSTLSSKGPSMPSLSSRGISRSTIGRSTPWSVVLPQSASTRPVPFLNAMIVCESNVGLQEQEIVVEVLRDGVALGEVRASIPRELPGSWQRRSEQIKSKDGTSLNTIVVYEVHFAITLQQLAAREGSSAEGAAEDTDAGDLPEQLAAGTKGALSKGSAPTDSVPVAKSKGPAPTDSVPVAKPKG